MRQHKVNRNSWHASIYLWWYGHKYKNNAARKTKPSTNLCPYMRAIMFWAPLRFIFWNWFKVYEWSYDLYISLNMLTIPFLMVTLPILAGFGSYRVKHKLWILDLIILGSIALITVIAAAACLIEWAVEEYKENHPKAPKKIKVKTTSKFTKLVKDFMQSAHDGVCPEITFTNTDEPIELTIRSDDPNYDDVEEGGEYRYDE